MTNTRYVSWSALAVTTCSLFFTSCATPTRPAAAADDTQASLLQRIEAMPQDAPVPMSQVHPRTMAQLGFQLGDQDLEVNTGAGVVSGSNDAYGFRVRGEHFLESEFGLHADVGYSDADDLDNTVPRSGITNTNLFFGLAYRATMDDDFRLPVRFGPFFSKQKQQVTGGDGDIERTTVGVKLSAEPEYIVFQHAEGGKITELSAFAEFGCGAGPSEVKDNVDSEDGYAFTFNYEIGARYRLPSGVMFAFSYFGRKNHYGATESYNNNVVFNGVDDDFTGWMISAGLRF